MPILLGIVFGFIGVIAHIIVYGKAQNYIEQKTKEQFRDLYGSSLHFSIDKIDWLAFKIYLSQISIKPLEDENKKDSDWSVIADKFILKGSWITLFTRFKIKFSGFFQHLIMNESLQEDAPSRLFEFLKKFFTKTTDSMVVYDSLHMEDALLLLQDKKQGLYISIPYSSHMSTEKNGARMQFYVKGGDVVFNNTSIIKDIAGLLVCDLPLDNMLEKMNMSVNMNMMFVPLQQKGACSFTGKIVQGKGLFVVQNDDCSLVIDPIGVKIDQDRCLVDAHINLDAEIFKQIGSYDFLQDMHGGLKINGSVNLYDFFKTLQLSVSLDNFLYKSTSLLKEASVTIGYKDSCLQGFLSIFDKKLFSIKINFDGKMGVVFIENNEQIPITKDFYIPQKGFSVKLDWDSDQKGFAGEYAIQIDSSDRVAIEHLKGTCSFLDQQFALNGSIKDIEYEGLFDINQDFICKKWQGKRGNNILFNFYTDDKNSSSLLGIVDFECIRMFAPDSIRPSFAQEGKLEFEGSIKNGVYYSQVWTESANIRIPSVYNVIQNATASCEIDIYNKTLVLKGIKAQLHEGEIECKQANLFFDSEFNCYFMHVPLLLHNVMLSWDKGIFMLLSGRLLLTKSREEPLSLDGQIIIEKSQVKDNLFSSDFQERLFFSMVDPDKKDPLSIDCLCNISFFTKDLLSIHTAFLSAKAKIDMLLHGSFKKPELSGIIQLLSGSFLFPYKPLEIVDGTLFFVPDQQLDPLIEVTAKGKIKRYGVSMRVFGSIFDPHVGFESAPYLTEEQIVSLLLLGIEESSLGAMVPAILMQKLKDIIFGPAMSKQNLQSRFDRLLNTLKHFRFLPQFTNQSGRGGVRGLFEIDASDHIHGKIDTNFMQLEDTKFDMDFALTDEVTLRMQKDGPSTYGGEVEVKWKFG